MTKIETGWQKWETRDPAEVLERREAQTCKGCRFVETIVAFGEKIKRCKKNRKHSDHGGRRCKQYAEDWRKE